MRIQPNELDRNLFHGFGRPIFDWHCAERFSEMLDLFLGICPMRPLRSRPFLSPIVFGRQAIRIV